MLRSKIRDAIRRHRGCPSQKDPRRFSPRFPGSSVERISRIGADGIFRQAMRKLGVPFLRRWMMWAAVRLGAVTATLLVFYLLELLTWIPLRAARSIREKQHRPAKTVNPPELRWKL